MRRILASVAVAFALLGIGWTTGRAAQTPQADFEIKVSSPSGTTTIECVRGCGLQFVRYVPDRSAARPSFTYTCGNPGGMCGGSVHGFLTR
jgi:hypothetical protein